MKTSTVVQALLASGFQTQLSMAAAVSTAIETTAAAQSSQPVIGGCAGVAPEYQLECYEQNCPMTGGLLGWSCASWPPEDQLACYQSRCSLQPPTLATAIQTIAASQPSQPLIGGCAGVDPEYQLECYEQNCPMPGPPGFSCGSLPPQYQLDCYEERCHDVYTSTTQTPDQQLTSIIWECDDVA